MNAALARIEQSRSPQWAAVAAGLVLLGIRPYVPLGVPLLAAAYLALASLAIGPPLDQGRPRVHPFLVAGVGLAGVLAAGTLAGPRLPTAGVTSTVILLNTLAAVGEEAFFRRFLYDRLARWGPGVAVAVSALAFAAVHVPAYGWAALPVDLGAGILLGWQRWASGTWLAPAATHVFANFLAVLP
jgi:membrane protease YdiL (CAAX protease family)